MCPMLRELNAESHQAVFLARVLRSPSAVHATFEGDISVVPDPTEPSSLRRSSTSARSASS